MTDIFTRLRDATEGSRELDARLYYKRQRDKDAILLNGRTWRQCMEFSEVNGDWSGLARAMDAPHYTTSIDAALTLVPEGWHWSIRKLGTSALHGGRVDLWNHEQLSQSTAMISVEAATPTLALCEAIFKARMAKEDAA